MQTGVSFELHSVRHIDGRAVKEEVEVLHKEKPPQ
jgi:hypothetical protein